MNQVGARRRGIVRTANVLIMFNERTAELITTFNFVYPICLAMSRLARKTSKSRPKLPRSAAPSIPAPMLEKLRAICLALPDAYEERAWVGIRWMVKKRNFAHVVCIDNGWPPAYARAVSEDGPLVVLTFRASASLRDILREADPRFFVPEWGTRWGTKVVGLKLRGRLSWREVKSVIAESHALLIKKSRLEARA